MMMVMMMNLYNLQLDDVTDADFQNHGTLSVNPKSDSESIIIINNEKEYMQMQA